MGVSFQEMIQSSLSKLKKLYLLFKSQLLREKNFEFFLNSITESYFFSLFIY